MILGRLVTRTDSASLSIIRPSRVTKIFVTGDVLCFFIQSGGASMLVQAKDQDGVKRGENIILGGLILQILVFRFFVVVAGVWHRRLEVYTMASTRASEIPWLRYIRLLYAASACITIRNTCRVVEYAMGRLWNIPSLKVTLTFVYRTDTSPPTIGLSTSMIFSR